MSATPLERREKLKADRLERLQRMIEIRSFEDRVKELFAEGVVHGTTHTCQGQEAVAVGLAVAARATDQITCTYRGHGVALALGLTEESVLAEIMGREPGSVGGLGGSMHLCEPDVGLLPTFAIVGAGIPVAAGAALTAQVRGTDDAAVAVFGDGASNIGAFHEGINLAAIWKLPVVFLCENNQYGEYSHVGSTTPITDIADRAGSYGIPGVVVDGQDPDAVEAAVRQALDRARAGDGPSLLEAKTYRYAGHSRADAAPYRVPGEFELWYERDPINRYRDRLISEGLLTQPAADALDADVHTAIEDLVARLKESRFPEVAAMFRNIYA